MNKIPGSFYKRSKYSYMNKKKLKKPKPYTKHNCLSSKEFYPDSEEFFQVAMFDPGTVSCGMRIVRYNLESKSMTIVKFCILNFGKDPASILINLPLVFGEIEQYLENCHHIVIETQLMKCITTYQTSTWILNELAKICNKKMRPMLIEVDCKLKTTFLGGPSNKVENGGVPIKEWSKEKAREVSIERDDSCTYHILMNSCYKANEDLSDVVCYEYAWTMYVLSRNDIFIPFDRKKLL